MTDHMAPLPPSMSQIPRASPVDLSGPPNKRPRLTTDFGATPTNGAYPAGGAQYPLSAVSPFTTPTPTYNTFTSQQPAPFGTESPATMAKPALGMMGPPERPKADKATDINDLSDLVFSAGVDLKEEESYLTAAYTNKRQIQLTTSFSSQHAHSQGSSQTLTPESSFAQWSQSPAAAQLAAVAHASGPLGQPIVTPEVFESDVTQRHIEAARQQAEAKTKHLSDPFLLAKSVRDMMHKRTYNAQVRLRQDGLVTTEVAPSISVSTAQDDGSTVIAARVTTLSETSSLVDLLSLLSLATQERVRSVLEDTYATSRARRHGAGGVVPVDFADIATGETKAEKTQSRAQSVTGTAWDAPVDAASPLVTGAITEQGDGAKSSSQSRPASPQPEAEQPLKATIRYPSRVPGLLLDIGNKELELERKRLQARKKREDAKNKKDETSTEAVPSAPETPVAEASPLPEAKITKKERERQAKASQTEEVLRKQANQTAHLALGKSKKYSWLTAASGGGSSTGLSTGAGQRERLARQSSNQKVAGTSAPNAVAEEPGLASKKRYKQIGLLKEAAGLQLRDLVNVLERDAKEKKALVRAYQRLQAEK